MVLLPRINRTFNSTTNQRGYATVLGVLLLTAVSLSAFTLFDVGQVSTNKVKMQNTVDAATYSASTIVARDLNFIAYTNRAAVANQVAIGQMVGLSSWVHMVEQATENLDLVANIAYIFPPLGAAVDRVTSTLETIAEGLVKVVDSGSKVIIQLNEVVLDALSQAQAGFHQALKFGALAVFKDVAQANDPDVKMGTFTSALSIADYFKNFNETLEQNRTPYRTRYTNTNKRHLKRYDEHHGVVLASRDKFTSNRKNRWFPKITLFPLRIDAPKYGGSELTRSVVRNRYVWEWTSMDTVSFVLGAWGCRLSGCKWRDAEIPLGWGAAHALNTNRNTKNFNYTKYNRRGCGGVTHNSRSKWGNGAWHNSLSSCFASGDNRDNNLRRTRSIRPFYDLKQDGLLDSGPSMVGFVIKPAGSVRTWKDAAKDIPGYKLQPRLDIAENGSLPKNQIASISKAQPYFARAHDMWQRRASTRRKTEFEFGNMYNPFWQARLIETSNTERILAASLSAGVSL